MKKTFSVIHPRKKVARCFEAVRCEIHRYVKRERRKALPEKADFWDFDCKFGDTEESAKAIHLAEFNRALSDAESRGLESFYVEILARPGRRTKKPKTGTDA